MKFIWIVFIIIAIEEMISNDILKNKKQTIIYVSVICVSIILCISYYSNSYSLSILGAVDKMVNLERLIWIK